MLDFTPQPSPPEITETHPVATPCRAWVDAYLNGWELITDLRGGTRAMYMKSLATGGRRWLRIEVGEEDEDYVERLERTVLHPAFNSAVTRLVAKPFARPVTIQEVPERLEPLIANADRAGRSFDQVLRDGMADAITYGLSFALVDMRRRTTPGRATQADANRGKLTPIVTNILAQNVIGWRSANVDGVHVLTQVRFRDYDTVPVDGTAYETETRKIVVVWNAPRINDAGSFVGRGSIEKWGKTEEGEWKPLGVPVEHTYPGIPLFPLYLNRTGFMTAESPLQALAELSLRHYNAQSDHDNGMRFARFPMYSMTGIRDDLDPVTNRPVVQKKVGPGRRFSSHDKDARFGVVETTGRALSESREDLRDLKSEMEKEGDRPLLERVTDSTATGVRMDQGESLTRIQVFIRAVEMWGKDIFGGAATWTDDELGDDFVLDVFNQFELTKADEKSAGEILKARQAGELSRKQFLFEWQRRGILDERMDVEAEIAAIEEEGPSLAEVGMPGKVDDETGQPADDEAAQQAA